MLGALEAKQRLVELLNAYVDARQESVRVVFELEEHAPEMAGLVLIAASARMGGESRGTIAVIGPKRMQYERTMNAVGYIAQVLERQGLAIQEINEPGRGEGHAKRLGQGDAMGRNRQQWKRHQTMGALTRW